MSAPNPTEGCRSSAFVACYSMMFLEVARSSKRSRAVSVEEDLQHIRENSDGLADFLVILM